MAPNFCAKVTLSLLLTTPLIGCSGGGCNDNAPPPSNVNPPGGLVRGDTLVVTSHDRLVSFNSSTPGTSAAVAITGRRANETLVGFELRLGGTPAGQLIALGNQGNLYTIDPNSGNGDIQSFARRGSFRYR